MLIESLTQRGQTKWTSLSASRLTLAIDSFMFVDVFQTKELVTTQI